ncbi:RHS repeat-associated core domain-containing protein [Ekhidna lutea]|uniref:RHS repeat-associated core domain-containing protein n=1 Tax=Ekhidna lutea TaxID=447679 RepID=A0A239GKU0_EKHLU|nr:RHS repeat-associated core domain-containing protein [Ekhidna lutea]SNS69432.1 RHS repeat-associated core domain-containing protein [Ekhidna lutea]
MTGNFDSNENGFEKLTLELDVPEDGYIYAYIVNESDKVIHWDDFTFSVMGTRAIRKTDYYPFGAVAKVWNNPDQTQQETYRFGYQGAYSEADSTTGWNAFELRMYDPLIGRWLQVDPMRQHSSPYLAMGNNPMKRVDPDGGMDGGCCKPLKTVIAPFDRTVANAESGWVWELGDDQSQFYIDGEGMYGGYLWNYDDYFSQNNTSGMVDQKGGIVFLTDGDLGGSGIGAVANFASSVVDISTGGLPGRTPGNGLKGFMEHLSDLVNAANLLGDGPGQLKDEVILTLNAPPMPERKEWISTDTIPGPEHLNLADGNFYKVDTIKENYSNGSQNIYIRNLQYGIHYHKK